MEVVKRIWHGIAWHSEERFTLTEIEGGYIAAGDLAGETEEGQLFVINYTLALTYEWDIEHLIVQDARTGHNLELVHKLGRWYDGQGVLLPQYDGVEYLDLSLTPFTNSLPIHTLDLADAEPEEIEVIYVSLPELKTHRTTQIYTKVGDRAYQYEDRDDPEFTAKIQVDDEGLVTLYEGLFEVDA